MAYVFVPAHCASARLHPVNAAERNLWVVAENGRHLGVLVQQLGYGVGCAALGALAFEHPLGFEGEAVLQQAGAVAADALGAGEGVGPSADVGDMTVA